MNIVRFNPWRELDRMEARGWIPAVDVWETPSAFRIDMDIPSVKAEDVDVAIDEGILTVSGERKRAERSEDDHAHRYERHHGVFKRRFRLPDNVDEGNVEAKVVNGVLQLSIGKRAEMQPRRIEVVAA